MKNEMKADTKVLTGRCHCGECSYEYKGKTLRSNYCDCKACQKATGTLNVPFVTFSADSFRMKTGELKKYRNPRGEKCDVYGEFHYCAKCSSPIYWRAFESEELDILAGTLDDTTAFTAEE